MRLLIETDLEVGMKRYSYPPPHGLIFHMNGRYNAITMEGVSFPLLVLLYDQQGYLLDRFTAQAHSGLIPIDPRTWTMIEIPI